MEDNKVYATEKLREYREEQNLSQREMADFLTTVTGKNISNSLYQKYEAGTENVPVDRALAISKITKIKFSELWEAK